jgi:hypothetical protein
MRYAWLLAVAVIALPAAAQAQDHSMHGMNMPMPEPTPTPAAPQDHSMHDMAGMDMPAAQDAPSPDPNRFTGYWTFPKEGCGSAAWVITHDDGSEELLDGAACWTANGSGTSRVPAPDGGMHGAHLMLGDWMLMAHGNLWGVYTDQRGPRGDDMAFVESIAMARAEVMATRYVRVRLNAMASLEPAMGARGYPDLFASCETAGGQPLIDRQHPHDLFMELSGRADLYVAEGKSLFVYGGPVAEPALGPTAFMHRGSARYLPLAPITHHWFDSTHISYGVVTAGFAAPRFQIEVSAFRGREPDERRWGLETPALDSWSVRASYQPNPMWLMQVSRGHLKSPETTHPGENEDRTTASIQYGGAPWHTSQLSAMLGFSAKRRSGGETLTAWIAEGNWALSGHHNLFGRIENVANDELFPNPADPLHDRKFRVTRFEAGYAYRVPLTDDLGLALGGSVSAYAKPAALDAAYGHAPIGLTVFAKLSLGD